MRHTHGFHHRLISVLAAVALTIAACGDGGEPATERTADDPPSSETSDSSRVDDGPSASISVDCERGSDLDELPYDPSRAGIFGDVPVATRWLQRTFRIENPTDHSVAFEPGFTIRYLDADGATVAELVDGDRNAPAFTVAAGQSAARTATAFDGINAAFMLAADPETVGEVLARTTACELVDPPGAVPVGGPTLAPADMDIAVQGPCALDDAGALVEQDVRVVNRGPRPAAVHPLVEVLSGSGERLGMLGTDGPTVVDAGDTVEITTYRAAFTVVDEPIDSCTTLSTDPDSPSLDLAARTEVLVDERRPTVERRDSDGNVVLEARIDRQLPVTFLNLTEESARPLVVWLHGLGGSAVPEAPLVTHLAEAGYVVAILNQPETSNPANIIAGYPLLPGDVGAVLDGIGDPDDGFADDIASVIDLDRTAVAGHSIGATGVLAMTANTCCADDRIDAGVTFGANLGAPFAGGEYRFSPVPLLLVNGTEDVLADHAEAEAVVAAANGNVSLLSLDGADHFTPVHGNAGYPDAQLAREAVTAFLDVHVAGTAEPETLEPFALTVSPGS